MLEEDVRYQGCVCVCVLVCSRGASGSPHNKKGHIGNQAINRDSKRGADGKATEQTTATGRHGVREAERKAGCQRGRR